MRNDKLKAIELRRQGKSYRDITGILNVPKSTLSEWLRPLDWSKNIMFALSEKARGLNSVRMQELNIIRGKQLLQTYEKARQEAAQEFHVLRYHPLFVAGIMLYWGEGDKVTKYSVKITNTDPKLMKIYVAFLLDVCQIKKEKLQASLLIYPDLNDKVCKEFWIRETGLDESNFRKSSVIKGRHKTKRIRYGICLINISSAYLKQKMLVWIDLFSQSLLSKEYYKPTNADVV